MGHITPLVIIDQRSKCAGELDVQLGACVNVFVLGIKLADIGFERLLIDSIKLDIRCDQSHNAEIINSENSGFVERISNVH